MPKVRTLTMSRLNSILVDGYYFATLGWRKWSVRDRAKTGEVPISILFYHRVADNRPNDWTISNAGFERQVHWLRRHCDLISLSEAQRRLRERDSQRRAVCITFDDGYADNCDRALPFLIEHQIPCTYFVALGFCVGQTPFPHDVVRNEPLLPNTIEQLREMANGGIEIGAHTRTHPDLGKVDDPDTLYDEVIRSAHELRKICGQPVPYFAFPFGQKENLNQDVFRLAREDGFLGACSAYGGYNTPADDDGFHLQRLHGDPMFSRIRNWVTVDPRLHKVERYQVENSKPLPEPIHGKELGSETLGDEVLVP